MQKIIIISDTHIPTVAKKLPPLLLKEIKKTNFTIHCGDFVSYSFYQNLSEVTKLYAVYGNMDEEKLKKTLPQKTIINCENIRIGLIHGRGGQDNLLSYINNEFKNNDVDIIIYGHSHEPMSLRRDNKLYFNPGSPTDTIFASYRSYGMIEIEGKTIKERIIKIG